MKGTIQVEAFRSQVHDIPKMKKFSFNDDEPEQPIPYKVKDGECNQPISNAPKSLSEVISQLPVNLELFSETFKPIPVIEKKKSGMALKYSC